MVAAGRVEKSSLQRRAKRACKTCNARRVRCNVLESQPCHNCVAAGITCELTPSRRGKYTRKPGHRKTVSVTTVPVATDIVAQGQNSIAEPHSEGSWDDVNEVAVTNSIQIRTQHALASNGHSEPDSAQTLREIVPSSGPDTGELDAVTLSESTAVNDVQAIDRTLFFGESNFLTCLAGGKFDSSEHSTSVMQRGNRLSYPISDAVNMKSSRTYTTRNPRISSAKYEYLRSEDAFTFPQHDKGSVVLKAYFNWFHPCFPILDRQETDLQFTTGDLSPLLYQAILFVGTSYCSEQTVVEMGFKDRPEAKLQFYSRCRLLYDADWESNKVAVLQSLFLMSFWRAGPLNEKNTRYWLGAAISLAQTRGFHRAGRASTMKPKQAKMQRRIWWSIYVRDRQSSASLGLPSRIRDEDCDVEMLTTNDMVEKLGNQGQSDGRYDEVASSKTLYPIEMAKLAKLLGKIITHQFSPNDRILDKNETSSLSDALRQWKSDLPPCLRDCDSESGTDIIWAYLLHLSYNYLHIVLHRKAYVRARGTQDSRSGDMALQAACRITRLVEDMLSQNLMGYGQLHVITSVFSSLCIHTISLQRSNDTNRKLAQHRAQMCLLGLKEVQKYWEVNNLVLELFFQYLDDATAKRLQLSEQDPPTDASTINRAEQDPQIINNPHDRLPNSDAALQNQETNLNLFPEINEDALFFDIPQDFLFQDSMADPQVYFTESSTPINDGLDIQGLDFLQRCL